MNPPIDWGESEKGPFLRKKSYLCSITIFGS